MGSSMQLWQMIVKMAVPGLLSGSLALSTHGTYWQPKPLTVISRIHVCFGYRRSCFLCSIPAGPAVCSCRELLQFWRWLWGGLQRTSLCPQQIPAYLLIPQFKYIFFSCICLKPLWERGHWTSWCNLENKFLFSCVVLSSQTCWLKNQLSCAWWLTYSKGETESCRDSKTIKKIKSNRCHWAYKNNRRPQ